jgi:hypothetical protein
MPACHALNRHDPNDLSLTTIASDFHDSTAFWRFDKTGPGGGCMSRL